ncbi:FG-GAP repeat domain-containing protein [Paenibacillus alginolyticus]|uniref:VCBS repeat-containing protein n=1 Tax=Paenibacillus alginolyticus TaxID=59839 RepID=A0ABT4GB57_9BACL|nr:VCBS repeat-containing protein [Paenibacillus alginolyticus]MCY9693421.1 VCBS repeat-containing protein [Paenibacillus alginolyticus]MEC0144681.1 VCBS repeat-containing protein [Paenibacillus alginolyticus]
MLLNITRKKSFLGLVAILSILVIIISIASQSFKEESIKLLYVTNQGQYDQAAYQNLEQTTVVNLNLALRSLDQLSSRQWEEYDAVYLDPSLHGNKNLQNAQSDLARYVKQGGHLFIENDLITDFPLDFIGASQVKEIESNDKIQFDYPKVDINLSGMQTMIKLFNDNFLKHIGMKDLPGFKWGKGIVPSSAETLLSMDNNISLFTMNRYGKGTVMCSGGLIPNRYFITGLDLRSGYDTSKGFPVKAEQTHPAPVGSGVAYFDFKQSQPYEPYFNFTFSAANQLLRSEFVSFVSKEKLGYSLKKVFGPYGRPAMAYQNHFEALSAIRDKEGIQWAELLKQYNQIPSFSLIRASFEWWKWDESITVHLNTGTSSQPQFEGELVNSFYGSGLHLKSGNQNISLATYPQSKELAAAIELPYRAYPAFADIKGNGIEDLLSGSADGFIYDYRNTGPNGNQQGLANLKLPDSFDQPEKLLDASDTPIHVVGYSTIYAKDINGDHLTDLVIGDQNGLVQYSLNLGNKKFSQPKAFMVGDKPLQVSSYAAPTLGDMTGDGVVDLIVGDGEGNIIEFFGENNDFAHFEQGKQLFKIQSKFAAPSIRDMNGDNKLDLVIGNSEGDIQIYENQNGQWIDLGPIKGKTLNQMGNTSLVGGHNSVPIWYDVNHDGSDDLIVGQLEYGLSYPIDDPQFPYKEELKEFIDYSKKNKLELYPHILVHNYESSNLEKEEINLHKKAFDELGIPWGSTGANQHTWRINNEDRVQTLKNEDDSGVWFNFGFKPSYDHVDPQWGNDFTWGLPFLLQDKTMKQPMLLFAPSPILRRTGDNATEDIYNAFVQLDMPIDYFEHVEYHFPNENRPSRVNELLDFVEYLDDIRNNADYNFVTEPQMARSFMASMTTRVTIRRPWITYVTDSVRNLFGNGKHISLTLSTATSDASKLAAEYQDSVGVSFEPGKRYSDSPFATNSDVFLRDDNRLYVGLAKKETNLFISWKKDDVHIVRSNVPVQINKSKNSLKISLNSEGMQQIKLFAPRPLNIQGQDLKIQYLQEQNSYVVTHFGEKTDIIVSEEK